MGKIKRKALAKVLLDMFADEFTKARRRTMKNKPDEAFAHIYATQIIKDISFEIGMCPPDFWDTEIRILRQLHMEDE